MDATSILQPLSRASLTEFNHSRMATCLRIKECFAFRRVYPEISNSWSTMKTSAAQRTPSLRPSQLSTSAQMKTSATSCSHCKSGASVLEKHPSIIAKICNIKFIDRLSVHIHTANSNELRLVKRDTASFLQYLFTVRLAYILKLLNIIANERWWCRAFKTTGLAWRRTFSGITSSLKSGSRSLRQSRFKGFLSSKYLLLLKTINFMIL